MVCATKSTKYVDRLTHGRINLSVELCDDWLTETGSSAKAEGKRGERFLRVAVDGAVPSLGEELVCPLKQLLVPARGVVVHHVHCLQQTTTSKSPSS